MDDNAIGELGLAMTRASEQYAVSRAKVEALRQAVREAIEESDKRGTAYQNARCALYAAVDARFNKSGVTHSQGFGFID